MRKGVRVAQTAVGNRTAQTAPGSSGKVTFIGLKDLVFSVLMGCLMLALGLVVVLPFAASLQATYFVVPGLAGIIWGVLFVVVMSKCPKTGAVIIPFVIYGAYMLSAGSVYVFFLFLATGLISELVMLKGGFQSTVRSFVPPLLMTLSNAMGGTFTMLLFRDNMIQTYMAMGMDEAAASATLAAIEAFWLAPENIALAIVLATAGALVGYVLGVKLLKKHFRPAGAV